MLSREDEYLFHTDPNKDFTELERMGEVAFGNRFTDDVLNKLKFLVLRMSTTVMKQMEHVQGLYDWLPATCPKCNKSQSWAMTVEHIAPTFACYDCGWVIDPDIWPEFIDEVEKESK